jgi:hypothetical protein
MDEKEKKAKALGYSNGYAAGKKYAKSERDRLIRDIARLSDELKKKSPKINAQKERVYMQSLNMALEHCNGWLIGGKRINNAEGYCSLARVFTKESIRIINDE